MIKLFRVLYFRIVRTYLSPPQEGCNRPLLIIVEDHHVKIQRDQN
jgi:hypothetical protein